jgi:hypothetical protein
MANILRIPVLTPWRIRIAFIVAVAADCIQLALGPLGWTFVDEIMDVAVMIALSVLIGFHPALLPTMLLEFIPVLDVVPFWTGSVALVISMRRGRQGANGQTQPADPTPNVIDV